MQIMHKPDRHGLLNEIDISAMLSILAKLKKINRFMITSF